MLMHSSVKLLDKILLTNSAESLNKKVVMVPQHGKYSYLEIKNKMNDLHPEGQAIKKAMENIVKSLLELDDMRGIRDILRMDFKIGK